MKALLLILLLALTVSAQSIKEGKAITEWNLLAEHENGIRTYYAPRGIRRGNGYTRLWLRADFPNGGSALFPDWHGAEIGSFRGFVTCDCQNGRLGATAFIVYGSDGRVLLEKKSKETYQEKPQSIGATLLQSFCEREASILKGPPRLKPNPSKPI